MEEVHEKSVQLQRFYECHLVGRNKSEPGPIADKSYRYMRNIRLGHWLFGFLASWVDK